MTTITTKTDLLSWADGAGVTCGDANDKRAIATLVAMAMAGDHPRFGTSWDEYLESNVQAWVEKVAKHIDGWTIYQGKEAAAPEMHDPEKWYFEPSDWQNGEVYSEGYDTREEAESAARAWDDQQTFEARQARDEEG